MNAHRTPEEIQAQLEARYMELEREAQKPERLYPCSSCRWHEIPGKYDRCYNPLVAGFEIGSYTFTDSTNAKRLCGPEKALWEPKLTRWQRFMEWMHRVIDRLEAPLALTGGKGLA